MEPPPKRYRQRSPPDFQSLASPAETPCLPTGVHKPSNAGARTLQRLHSVEHLFCSQTLDTPVTHLLEDKHNRRDRSECDFTISYSQNYTRAPSQSTEDGGLSPEGAGPSSWESESNHYQIPAVSHGDPNTTPELCLPEASNHDSPQASNKVFPMFRPKSQWKIVHIIRHGESEFNAATQSGPSFADPQIYDPKLTAKGRRQASALRSQLEGMKISHDALWVSSPLTRALETMLLACPHADLIGHAVHPLNVAVCKELSEQVMTTGDIGLPVSVMSRNFPQFSKALEELPERWWAGQDKNDAQKKQLNAYETKKALQARVGQFRKWVQNRSERVIVAFGHSNTFKALTVGHRDLRLKNCELYTLHF